MKIDFTNKRIVSTGINIKFTPSQRGDEWTIENELMALSMSIQMQLITKKTGNRADVYEWFSNIESLAQATTNKSYDCLGKIESYSPDKPQPYNMIWQSADGLKIDALDYMDHQILSDEGKKQIAEENERAKAVAIAKRELIKEQELRDELEAEEEAMKEANTLRIVQPIKGYMTNDS
tara:strand:- start:420 stop:953 length:534 start_codon:yes stop_codon:yes gene_type:complete